MKAYCTSSKTLVVGSEDADRYSIWSCILEYQSQAIQYAEASVWGVQRLVLISVDWSDMVKIDIWRGTDDKPSRLVCLGISMYAGVRKVEEYRADRLKQKTQNRLSTANIGQKYNNRSTHNNA